MSDPSVAKSTFAEIGNLVLFAQDEGFIGSTMFFVLMGALLLGLIGFLVYRMTRRPED